MISVGDHVMVKPWGTDHKGTSESRCLESGIVMDIELGKDIDLDVLEGRLEGVGTDRIREAIDGFYSNGLAYIIRPALEVGNETILLEPFKAPYNSLLMIEQAPANKLLKELLLKT